MRERSERGIEIVAAHVHGLRRRQRRAGRDSLRRELVPVEGAEREDRTIAPEGEVGHRHASLRVRDRAFADLRRRRPRFQQALAVARTQGARLWELRAATDLARLWSARGHETKARVLLDGICGASTEGFDGPDLIRARELRARL